MARITTLVFAKYPQPGAVNTRMVPPLTPTEAAELHTASLLAVCESIGSIADLDTKLVVTPDERVSDLGKLVGASECWPQGDGDLGRRLARATDRAFGAGAEGVLLLGADSPTLPVSFLTTAVANLSRHQAILGPSDDGGYYLLGVRQPLPVLLERIDWGGEKVADQTRQRALAAGIDLWELPAWYDLDRFDDLKRAVGDLVDTAQGPAATVFCRYLEAIVERYAGATPTASDLSADDRPGSRSATGR